MNRLTAENIRSNTRMAIRHAEELRERLERYESDVNADQRMTEKLCRTCFYLRPPSIACQAFTSYVCNNCNKADMYHNGNVPKYCKECASEHNACRRCGADIIS